MKSIKCSEVHQCLLCICPNCKCLTNVGIDRIIVDKNRCVECQHCEEKFKVEDDHDKGMSF